METAFTLLLGVEHPLQQAVMGGVSGPELAGAVARAGALGMLCEFDDEAARTGERSGWPLCPASRW